MELGADCAAHPRPAPPLPLQDKREWDEKAPGDGSSPSSKAAPRGADGAPLEGAGEDDEEAAEAVPEGRIAERTESTSSRVSAPRVSQGLIPFPPPSPPPLPFDR